MSNWDPRHIIFEPKKLYRNRPNFGHCPNFGHFWVFYVLLHKFEMPHYFNDVKVPKNFQDQCEFKCLFIF